VTIGKAMSSIAIGGLGRIFETVLQPDCDFLLMINIFLNFFEFFLWALYLAVRAVSKLRPKPPMLTITFIFYKQVSVDNWPMQWTINPDFWLHSSGLQHIYILK
jgi:hypothetical protein